MHDRMDIPPGLPDDIVARRVRATAMFQALRDRICTACEMIEDSLDSGPHSGLPPGRFERTDWKRAAAEGEDGGGGTMAVLRGRVFEKIGVNFSEVRGRFSETFARELPGTEADTAFWASGVSLVAHLRSPLIPAAHMNIRFITTDRWWFGGGGDLTPTTTPVNADTEHFHAAYQAACDTHGAELYPRYRDWCDRYFYLHHRGETRGVGGIFFDYLNSGNWEADSAFVRDVGEAYLQAHLPIVRERMHAAWSDADRAEQLRRRGRYVEFNLVYDRGTRFGLMTGGNPEAVLMSLPPIATWP